MNLQGLIQAELDEQRKLMATPVEVVERLDPKPLPERHRQDEDRTPMRDIVGLIRIGARILLTRQTGQTSTLGKRLDFYGRTMSLQLGLPSGSSMSDGGVQAHSR